jgi:hypothetical protein
MRDNSKGLPEIIKVFSSSGNFFAYIKIIIDNIAKVFEIGLNSESFLYLNKMFSVRPFDNRPGIIYKYYFVPSIRHNAKDNKYFSHIFIEQGNNKKQFEIELNKEIISNLKWFFELKDFNGTSHLKEIL